MSIMIQRAISRTLLGLAALAVLAVGHNHTTQPCTSGQYGAAGMCVTTSIGGGVL